MDKLNQLLDDIRVDSGVVEGEIFSIGGGGLRKLSKVTIYPNTIYGFGASSSPDLIFVTRVTPDRVFFTNYSMGYRGERSETRPIADDLIERGSRALIRSRMETAAHYSKMDDEYAKAHAKRFAAFAKKMQAALDGKRVPKENVTDWELWDLHLVATNPPKGKMTRATDPWYAAEEYGNVGSMDDPRHGTVYHVTSVRGDDYKKLKAGRDKRFKVIKATPYKGHA